MTNANAEPQSTLVDRWLQDQQQWQRTLLAYYDSMVKNPDFLVHLGNAMRGSLLAGKAYPGTAEPAAPPADDRLDQVLFALNKLQGQLQDLFMTMEEIRDGLRANAAAPTGAPAPTRSAAPTAASARSARPKKRPAAAPASRKRSGRK